MTTVHAMEDVVHAVCSDKYQPDTGELSPRLYEGRNVSVSRLAVVALAEQWPLLARTVQKLPGRRLEAVAKLNVGRLVETAKRFTSREKPEGILLAVVEDPTPHNPAHAEIRGDKITSGLSRQLCTMHELLRPPAGFDPAAHPRSGA